MESTARRIEGVAAEPAGLEPEPSPEIADLLDGLRSDPEDSWDAFQGLEALDADIRRPIVGELLAAPASEGLIRLLHLLGASRDDDVRSAVRKALGTDKRAVGRSSTASLPALVHRERPRLIRSLATAVDGEGVGAVVVSSTRGGRSITAAFLCDVRGGIRDVLGAEEGEANGSDPFGRFPDLFLGPIVEDAHPLSVGLLAGSLLLSGRETPPAVRERLDATLGEGFHAGAFLSARPEWGVSTADSAVLADRSWRILEACPGWVDRSTLTFDLAEEISVRERRAAADPVRDSGAYRFLFERRLLHRLELYRRMLLWMAFFWDASGETELSLAAGVLSGQLGDPQFAVPSHPFTVALTTRSLHEAQRLLGTGSDPRRD